MGEQNQLLNQYSLTFLLPSDLKQGYAIIGDGAYVVDLYQYIIDRNLPKPEAIYIRQVNARLPLNLQKQEQELQLASHNQIILGTNSFHFEILQRVDDWLCPESQICDLLMQKPQPGRSKSGNVNFDTFQYFWQEQPTNKSFVLIVTLYPLVTVEQYLKSFVAFLKSNNIGIFVRHPLQPISEDVLQTSLAVIIWNGSTAIFDNVKQSCLALNKAITYAECGFFPQHRHFYFDRQGVNLKSQLTTDDLHWVCEATKNKLEQTRDQFFADIQPRQENEAYVFVPLQVPDDSNVQQHSRFSDGMQEFIDFVLKEYQGQRIIIKAHPKDRMWSEYQIGPATWSTEDARSLILGAEKVVGINSSVLYEAALAGKPVDCHGENLLNSCKAAGPNVLCAMVERQFQVDKTDFSAQELSQFSWLHQANIWSGNSSHD